MATKTVRMYSIHQYKTANSYSTLMFRALRSRSESMRVVRWLKRRGHDVFAAKMAVTVAA